MKNIRYVVDSQSDSSLTTDLTGMAGDIVGGLTSILSLVNHDTIHTSVSAGEENNNGYRAWIKGVISSTKHDSDDKLDYSYKFLSKRLVLGADKILEDGGVLGAFYQYTDGELKCDGDRNDNTDHGIALRGSFNLTDQIGMVSAGAFARSNVKGDSLPSGKTINSVNIYNALNYTAKVGDFFLVKPKVGIEYMNINRKKYSNKDGLELKGLMISLWDAYTGLSLKSTAKINDFTYRIKLFGDLYHNIASSKSSVCVIIPQENVVTEVEEGIKLRSKTRWSLGTSFGLWYMDRYKVKSSYTYSRIDKDVTHIGTLTFAIEF